jgi:AcrR family transcriptional regulator
MREVREMKFPGRGTKLEGASGNYSGGTLRFKLTMRISNFSSALTDPQPGPDETPGTDGARADASAGVNTTAAEEPARPMRADARRNYDSVVAAAREAFAEGGTETSLEGIARRAGVGIGTLYRHFPTRQALLEVVYRDEVEQVCRSADELQQLPAWEGFVAWMHRLADYLVTKQALAHELLDYVDKNSDVFKACRSNLFEAGEPLLSRAQEQRAVRDDTNLAEIIQLIGGITKIQTTDPAQRERILSIALDGLKYRE